MTDISQSGSRQTDHLHVRHEQPHRHTSSLRSPFATGGVNAPWRVMIHIGTEGTTALRVEILKELTVGRADPVEDYIPGLDLSPYGGQDAGVSRRHAMLFIADGKLHMRDLDSTNGTRINDLALKPNEPYVLSEGDEIEFGQLRAKIHLIRQPS
ncbi:MAG: FHA domain-containing protein [Chloroflexota bacterium]